MPGKRKYRPVLKPNPSAWVSVVNAQSKFKLTKGEFIRDQADYHGQAIDI